MAKDKEIIRVVEEVFVRGTLHRLKVILDMNDMSARIVPIESFEIYEVIAGMGLDTLRENNAMVNTKYKTIDKKVKPATGALPTNNERKRKEVSEDLSLRKSMDIEHTFTDESVKKVLVGVKYFL